MIQGPHHFQFHSTTEQWLSASFSHWNHQESLWKTDSWASSQACWITCPGGLRHHLAVEASGPGYTRMGRGRRIQVAKHEPACSSLATTEGPQVLFKQRFLFCKVPWELVSSLQKSALLNKIPSHYPCQKKPKLHVCCRWRNTSWSGCIWCYPELWRSQPFLTMY